MIDLILKKFREWGGFYMSNNVIEGTRKYFVGHGES